MTLSPSARKLALTAHVTVSVGWFGAALAYVSIVAVALRTEDARMARSACIAIEPMTWYAIVPLAILSLLTGLVQSLGTPWGLFKHWWVVYKLALTVFATAVLFGNTRAVKALAGAGVADPFSLKRQLVHAAGGAVVLLLATVLAVYKPGGTTPLHLPRRG